MRISPKIEAADAAIDFPSSTLDSLVKAGGDGWGPYRKEIQSLKRESDPELFFEALLHLGKRLERAGKVEQASLVYSVVAAPPHPCPSPQGERENEIRSLPSGERKNGLSLSPPGRGVKGEGALAGQEVPSYLQHQAQERLSAIQGGGSFGVQLEHMGRTFTQTALDPGMLLGGTGMGLFGKGAELLAMGWLSNANFFRRTMGLGKTAMKMLPRFGGFAAEASAFPFAVNGANELLGRPASWERMDERVVSSWFFLGGMRIGGSLGASASRHLGVPGLQTFGSIGGIMLGHGAEVVYGLKEYHGLSNFTMEAMGTWVNLKVAGQYSDRVFGGHTSRLRQVLDLQSQKLENSHGNQAPFPWLGKLLAPAGLVPSFAVAGRASFPSPLSFMVAKGPRLSPSQPGKTETGSTERDELNEVWRIEGLEEVRVRADELLDQAKSELQEIAQYLQTSETSFAAEHLKPWRTETGVLRQRTDFWDGEIRLSEKDRAQGRALYLQDISIGLRLLLGRVNRLAAEVHSQPPLEAVLPPVGLWRPRPVRIEDPATRAEEILPALRNFDVGFGERLSLRPHQIEAVKKIFGWLKAQRRKFESTKPVSKGEQELLQGTVVMPTGAGKTRSMVAAFATAMELGLFRPGEDKFLILNHTDEIHKQNLEVAHLLNEYFERRYGRPLRVSEYKAEQKELGGDLVVISVPTASGEGRRSKLAIDLARELGTEGRITMVAVDEVHHLGLGIKTGKESWPELIEVLRGVSPNFYRIGFTATPTGHEGAVLFRKNQVELMREGITPRTYLVKTEGIDLTEVPLRSGDFTAGELRDTLISEANRIQRHTRLFEALEKYGIKIGNSPSGKPRIKPVLGFGADLKHARALGEDYLDYFAKGQGDLRGRRLVFLGRDDGKINPKEFAEALKKYEHGEIDGIVVLVSGHTKNRKEIFQVVQEGMVEAVFSVDALVEGADLFMFTHQLGARPTFSMIKKGQERGRINRRGPEEISVDGKIIQDSPKILFEVIDQYRKPGISLVSYGLAMGVEGHTAMKAGGLYDLLTGEAVQEADLLGRTGMEISVRGSQFKEIKGKSPARRKGPLPNFVPRDWEGVSRLFREIFEDRYGKDLESLAWDLGATTQEASQLMEGIGWRDRYWFLRRMATLLYQDDREIFVKAYNEGMGHLDERVSDADHDILLGALQVYESLAGAIPEEGVVLKHSFPWGEEEIKITKLSLKDLKYRRVGDQQWKNLAAGLMAYFDQVAKTKDSPQKKREMSQAQMEKLIQHVFERNHWAMEAKSSFEKLLLTARRGIAFRFGGVLPREPGIEGVTLYSSAPLRHWLRGGEKNFSSRYPPSIFYHQVRSLLKGLGVDGKGVDELIQAAVFEEQRWPQEARTPRERLLLTIRRAVASHFGGALPSNTGIEGVPKITPLKGPLRRWLRSGEKSYRYSFGPSAFYHQVRSLLKGLGVADKEGDELIRAAIFEEQGWPEEAKTAREKLLLTSRKAVALHFSGALPIDTGIEGVPILLPQNSPLKRWLNGEEIKYKNQFNPSAFYHQVRSLLKGLSANDKEADELIQGAVFEEQGWPKEARTPREKLLLTARKTVALRFGGVLPADTGVEGVPHTSHKDSPINRWLRGEEIKYGVNLTTSDFYNQVRSLLKGMGVNEKKVDWLTQEAVFAEQGWPKEARAPREKLILTARRAVALHFGGVLPARLRLTGVPENTFRNSPLNRWLKGGKIEYGKKFTASLFYSQIRSLLKGLGIDAKEVDELIQAAVFEEQGWPLIKTPREKLLLIARKAVALRFGGVLPTEPRIEGVSKQAPPVLLTRWLKGEEVPSKFRNFLLQQIQALLKGLGVPKTEIETLFKELES